MNREIKRILYNKIKKSFLVILIVIVISFPLFLYFRVNTGANLCLREAKNIKLAFKTVDIEYYAKNKIIYNPNNVGNMEDGVFEQIDKLLDIEGKIEIISYNKKDRMVTSFSYTKAPYRILYEYTKDGDDTWGIDYIINIKKQEE